MKKGCLITFEGPEGSGKTTQIRKLQQSLQNRGFRVVSLREPGGTQIGDEIRSILHDLKHTAMDEKTEALLYQASRAQIVAEVIRPALNQDQIVLLDRFCDSTLAYQGFARGLGAAWLDTLNEFSTDNLTPDLTLLLDIPVEIGLKRKQTQEEWNRLDALPLKFHQKVRQGYLTLCQADDTNRWHYVDANRSPDEVYQDILKAVELKLTNSGFIERVGVSKERKG